MQTILERKKYETVFWIAKVKPFLSWSLYTHWTCKAVVLHSHSFSNLKRRLKWYFGSKSNSGQLKHSSKLTIFWKTLITGRISNPTFCLVFYPLKNQQTFIASFTFELFYVFSWTFIRLCVNVSLDMLQPLDSPGWKNMAAMRWWQNMVMIMPWWWYGGHIFW